MLHNPKTLQVVTLPQKQARDVVDYVEMEEIVRQYTPAPSGISPTVASTEPDEAMHEQNFEFSDIEMESELPRKRTRSQSRNKETMPPQSDPVLPPKKGRKAVKKADGVTQRPRRRRVIHEEITDEDEWARICFFLLLYVWLLELNTIWDCRSWDRATDRFINTSSVE